MTKELVEKAREQRADEAQFAAERIIEFTIDGRSPNDSTCAEVAGALSAALYGDGAASRIDQGAYVCGGRGECRVFAFGALYQVVTDFITPEWVKPWLESRFGAQIHGEARTDVDALREVADMRARELRDVWRIVVGSPAEGDVPMVYTAVRLMRERHDSYMASAKRLSDETVELRADRDRLQAELDALRAVVESGPDLDDDLTRIGVLAVVRRAWHDPHAFCYPNSAGGWTAAVFVHNSSKTARAWDGPTEEAALLAALEAAPQ